MLLAVPFATVTNGKKRFAFIEAVEEHESCATLDIGEKRGKVTRNFNKLFVRCLQVVYNLSNITSKPLFSQITKSNNENYCFCLIRKILAILFLLFLNAYNSKILSRPLTREVNLTIHTISFVVLSFPPFIA